MAKINPGDKLHCTKGDWINGNRISNFVTPKENEQVTVREVMVRDGHTLISLEGYDRNIFYPAKFFRPQFHLFSQEVIKSITLVK